MQPKQYTGTIARISGPVLDVRFPVGEEPPLNALLRVTEADKYMEVFSHEGQGIVRCVALDATEGLSCGLTVVTDGEGIKAPVGPKILGRVVDVRKPVGRVSYRQIQQQMRSIQRRSEEERPRLSDEVIRRAVARVVPMMTNNRQWFCIYRVLADKGVLSDGAFYELSQLVNRLFPDNDYSINAKDLSREYYQVNKVGSLMSLFTNDLETVRECFGWGVMMFFDALIMGTLAIVKMWRMNQVLALLSLIPMALLLASATVVGRHMMIKWDKRQEAFSKLSDL